MMIRVACPDCSRIVLVDGVYRADLSDLSGLPAGVTVGPLSEIPTATAAHLPQPGKQVRNQYTSHLRQIFSFSGGNPRKEMFSALS
eukprot:871659-Pyramimonas_sp.AAC.2